VLEGDPLIRRFAIPVFAAVTLLLFGFAGFDANEKSNDMQAEFELRAKSVSSSLQRALEPVVETAGATAAQIQLMMDRVDGGRYGLLGAVLLGPGGEKVESAGYAERIGLRPEQMPKSGNKFLEVAGRSVYYSGVALSTGRLGLFFDATELTPRQAEVWLIALRRALLETVVCMSVILLLLRTFIVTPLTRVTEWAKGLRAGRSEPPSEPISLDQTLHPLVKEVRRIAVNWKAACETAEEEARLREAGESLWTKERLRVFLEKALDGSRMFVVSNRQPYEHVKTAPGSIEVRVPASGLVTAMEPILQASDGTWIAHGAGTADRETVDDRDRLPVPPEDPRYTLRRVWLSKAEEQGYYYGFANEGLWPLCHIAHTRPLFRQEDWDHYRRVNQKFADAVVEEMEGSRDPLLLVQDYHFALLPAMVKRARPDARVAVFWHIPWPNPEAFGICPWQADLLEGLLGADLIGFHTQTHCSNFMQTVDRALESRIDHDRKVVNRGEHFTTVRPFPISVNFSRPAVPAVDRFELLQRFGPRVEFFGIGVDRMDYTKGIPERFHGIERFLEENPAYRERVTFVQIGVPTRTQIRRYQDILTEIRSEAARINKRFGTRDWNPILLLDRHHTHAEIDRYYRHADFCMVTALHDGMNLVAKEYVASRDEDTGVLILSRFAGAAQELGDALQVNPYDTGELALSIRSALEMSPEEMAARMKQMRQTVRQRNIFWWAAELVGAAAEIRPTTPSDRQSAAPAPLADPEAMNAAAI